MRKRFTDMNCSVARALDVLGDWWTLLLIREAFLGTRRFADFEANLEISKNVLTDRLDRLTQHGVFVRIDAGQHGRRYEYALTQKGKDLITVLTALREWGDRWIFGEGNEPLLVFDRRTGRPVPPLRIRGEDGAPLGSRELEVRVGPGVARARSDSSKRHAGRGSGKPPRRVT
jgi:DNA-binding HxlR family transcriptional regulator